jgi:hypothetical protein
LLDPPGMSPFSSLSSLPCGPAGPDRDVRALVRSGGPLLAAVGAVLVATAPARPATACSALPTIHHREIVPPDGSREVPLNARVVLVHPLSSGLSFSGPGPDLRDIVVRARGGAPVEGAAELVHDPITQRTIIWKPKRALQPNTTYEVLDRIGKVPCHTECVGELGVRATFETGSAVDTTPPAFEGLTGFQVGARNRCTSSACCGPYDSVRLDPAFAPARDDHGPVHYEVYVDGRRVLSFGRPDLRGEVTCDGRRSPDGAFVTTVGARVSLRAVDLAGNASVGDVAVTVPSVCTPAPPGDGGAPDGAEPPRPGDAAPASPSLDASGTERADGAAGTGPSGGGAPADAAPDKVPPAKGEGGPSCAFGGGSGRAGAAGGWLVLLGLAWGWRRRRGR